MSDVREIDTGTPDLLCRVDQRAAVVTFNRPDARNALSPEMKESLRELLPRLGEDPDVRSLLLTGEGRAFCSGGDTKAMAKGDAIPRMDDRIRRVHKEHEIPAALHEMTIPTIAALPGAAAGAGFSMSLPTDRPMGWLSFCAPTPMASWSPIPCPRTSTVLATMTPAVSNPILGLARS